MVPHGQKHNKYAARRLEVKRQKGDPWSSRPGGPSWTAIEALVGREESEIGVLREGRCPDGTWVFLDDWVGLPSGDSSGKPMVEVGAKGGATGESNHHHNLFYRDTDNIWKSWIGMVCHNDDDFNWDGRKIAADHFETIEVDGNYC
jgi:hypothetical protein